MMLSDIPSRYQNRLTVAESGCWVWSGCLTWAGYGQINRTFPDGVQRRQVFHRYVWETFVGPIPPGLELDHLCRVRACCNPAHLEPVTPAENKRRAGPPLMSVVNAAKTHCARGHAFDEANTVYRKGTTNRTCRACALRALHKHRRRPDPEDYPAEAHRRGFVLRRGDVAS